MRTWVMGAGTMGRGIAQVLAEHNVETVMIDPVENAAQRSLDLVHDGWSRQVSRGRMTEVAQRTAQACLRASNRQPAEEPDWVIEAAPESLTVKQELFAQLDQTLSPGVRFASNTSSIAIALLQGPLRFPERLGGLHFFNPVPRMALVEVIPGLRTGPSWLEAARGLGTLMGKTVIEAPDRPGFVVNRVARPLYGEALRIFEEGVAPVDVIDAVMEAAGFPMGPFRLMDLVGIDVNLAVTESVYAQTFQDPRYRPHPVQALMVASGRLGRKSDRGFYDYTEAPRTPAPCAPDSSLPLDGIVLGGQTFRAAWAELGLPGRVGADPSAGSKTLPWIVSECPEDIPWDRLGPDTLVITDGTVRHQAAWSKRRRPDLVYGFDPALVAVRARAMTVAGAHVERVAGVFGSLKVFSVNARLGHVFSRLIAMLVNEAVGFRPALPRDTVDLACRLGLNHPKGPYQWLDILSPRRLVDVLDALTESGGDRYRAAEDLRVLAMTADGS